MHAEEPGAREERQRDQEEAGVPPAAGGFAGCVRKDAVDRGGREHEPEMARMVLPDDVEPRHRQQDPEPGDGQREEDRPDGETRTR